MVVVVGDSPKRSVAKMEGGRKEKAWGFAELVGISCSTKFQSDHDARIFRVLEDPVRATRK